MAQEEVLRARAVSMYTQGQSVSDIAKALGRSRQWVHKWINRSQCDSADWSQSLSTAPHYVPNKVSLSMEEQVISARQQLLASPYHEAGAYAILHQLQGKGITPPSVATINRILKRNGLVTQKVRRSKSGLDYPEEPIDMHVMDLIGPRYLHGGGRFYMLTIISNDTRHAGVYPIPSKSGENITQSVIRFWQSYSLPCFLKLDNELSFRGSNRHPRGLGLLLRTALSLNVVPIFIPVSEPWRNGVIERFNQKVEDTLLTQEHNSFEELCFHVQQFVQTHNQEHHYSTMGHKTPAELDQEQACFIKPLSPDYQLCERPPLDSGNLNEIRFIRLVRSDLTINVLNTVIPVKKELMYTYVEAVLLVNEHRLLLKQDNQAVQSVEFVMPLC